MSDLILEWLETGNHSLSDEAAVLGVDACSDPGTTRAGGRAASRGSFEWLSKPIRDTKGDAVSAVRLGLTTAQSWCAGIDRRVGTDPVTDSSGHITAFQGDALAEIACQVVAPSFAGGFKCEGSDCGPRSAELPHKALAMLCSPTPLDPRWLQTLASDHRHWSPTAIAVTPDLTPDRHPLRSLTAAAVLAAGVECLAQASFIERRAAIRLAEAMEATLRYEPGNHASTVASHEKATPSLPGVDSPRQRPGNTDTSSCCDVDDRIRALAAAIGGVALADGSIVEAEGLATLREAAHSVRGEPRGDWPTHRTAQASAAAAVPVSAAGQPSLATVGSPRRAAEADTCSVAESARAGAAAVLAARSSGGGSFGLEEHVPWRVAAASSCSTLRAITLAEPFLAEPPPSHASAAAVISCLLSHTESVTSDPLRTMLTGADASLVSDVSSLQALAPYSGPATTEPDAEWVLLIDASASGLTAAEAAKAADRIAELANATSSCGPGDSSPSIVLLVRAASLASLGRAMVCRAAEAGRRCGAATAFAEALGKAGDRKRTDVGQLPKSLSQAASAGDATATAGSGLKPSRGRSSAGAPGVRGGAAGGPSACGGDGDSDTSGSAGTDGGGRRRARQRRRGKERRRRRGGGDTRHRGAEASRQCPENQPMPPTATGNQSTSPDLAGSDHGRRLQTAAAIFPCPAERDVVEWLRDACLPLGGRAGAAARPVAKVAEVVVAAGSAACVAGEGSTVSAPATIVGDSLLIQLAALIAPACAALHRAERRKSLTSARAEIASTGALAGILVDREAAELEELEGRAAALWTELVCNAAALAAADVELALLRDAASLAARTQATLLPLCGRATRCSSTGMADAVPVAAGAQVTTCTGQRLTQLVAAGVTSIACALLQDANVVASLDSLTAAALGLAVRASRTRTVHRHALSSAQQDPIDGLPRWMRRPEPRFGAALGAEGPGTTRLSREARRFLALAWLRWAHPEQRASPTPTGAAALASTAVHAAVVDVEAGLSALGCVSDALAAWSAARIGDAEEDDGVSDTEFETLRREGFACKAVQMGVGALSRALPAVPASTFPQGGDGAGAGDGSSDIVRACDMACRVVVPACERVGVVPAALGVARPAASAMLAQAFEALGVARDCDEASFVATRLLRPAESVWPGWGHCGRPGNTFADADPATLAWAVLLCPAWTDGSSRTFDAENSGKGATEAAWREKLRQCQAWATARFHDSDGSPSSPMPSHNAAGTPAQAGVGVGSESEDSSSDNDDVVSGRPGVARRGVGGFSAFADSDTDE